MYTFVFVLFNTIEFFLRELGIAVIDRVVFVYENRHLIPRFIEYLLLINDEMKVEDESDDEEERKPLTFSEICDEYADDCHTKFMGWVSDVETTDVIKSKGVDAVFYDLDMYKKVFSVAKNGVELAWTRRVLLETTPYGVVGMYYDAYKHAFSYFCDQRSVSYKVLNGVAMKYVRRFCCLDFFVDEVVYPGSRLLLLWREAEKNEAEEKRGKKEDSGLDFLKGAPFIRAKPSGSSKSSKDAAYSAVKKEEEKNMNKFVYIGNLQMHFTQLYFKAPAVVKVATKAIDPVKARMSYKDFIQGKGKSGERPDWTMLSKNDLLETGIEE